MIHAGALHKPDIVRYPEAAFVDVNVDGTRNLLDAAVAAGNDRFVFTSTTSLMISEAIRAGKAGGATRAAWLDEESGPLGAAQHLRRHQARRRAAVPALSMTSTASPSRCCAPARFFPEDDDTHREPAGPNIKANEFLNRRLTVEDAAEAHVVALERAPALGFDTFILSAPPPFVPADCEALIARRAGGDRALFPGCGRALCAQSAGRCPADRPGLRSVPGRAPARLSLPHRFRRDARRAAPRRPAALRARSLPMSRPRKWRQTGPRAISD